MSRYKSKEVCPSKHLTMTPAFELSHWLHLPAIPASDSCGTYHCSWTMASHTAPAAVSDRIMTERSFVHLGTGQAVHTVILDPQSGDADSVSPGVEKTLRTVQRERDDLTRSTRLAIDPATARRSMKKLGKKLTIPPAHRCAPDTPTTTSVL